MARALELARIGWYTTAPNPRVGCAIVKDGKIIAEGWHAKAGEDHAEAAALKKLDSAQGATAYVSLEPCSHYGKTPPCCDALIAAGVSRVVAAMSDPNPLVAGRGLQKLRDAGIQVDVGLMQEQAELLNRGFIKRMRTGLPLVRCKMAMSLDGRTAMASGESQWISSAASRADVQRLRAESSAILTGIETVLADDPRMNARVDFEHIAPIRVILDSSLRMPVTAKMRSTPGRIMILTGADNHTNTAQLEQAGFEVHRLPLSYGRLKLSDVLFFLGQQQINVVLIEAGPTLNGAFLAENLLDEGIVYLAPTLMGDNARGLFHLPALQQMAQKKSLRWQEVRAVGSDLRLTFTLLT